MKSLCNALRILDAFSLQPPVWGVRELSQYSGLSPSVVQRALAAFHDGGFLQQCPQSKRYEPGARFWEYGQIFRSHLRLDDVIARELRALADASGETAWFILHRGWPVYNVDAVERGRAGWALRDPHFASPAILRTAEDSFCQFRIGARVPRATPDALRAAAYRHCQFPLAAFEQFMCQVVPRWATTDDLILNAYCRLLDRLGPQIIIAHSQGAAFALRAAARRPDKVKTIVAIEPAQGGGEEALTALAAIPLLLVYGDNLHLDARWPQLRTRTDAYFAQLSTRGARVDILDLPRAGLLGNSHMLMMEHNNHAIAALIARWLMDIPDASRAAVGDDVDG